MTQTDGLVILIAWLILGALVVVLTYFLLRYPIDVLDEAEGPTPDPLV
jgi:hypothetical protein